MINTIKISIQSNYFSLSRFIVIFKRMIRRVWNIRMIKLNSFSRTITYNRICFFYGLNIQYKYKYTKKLIRFSSKIELNELVTKGNLMSYHHFTIDERESILVYRTQGLNFSQIAKLLHRQHLNIKKEKTNLVLSRLYLFINPLPLTMSHY